MKYLKMLMIYSILILSFNLFISILFYFDLINGKTLDILNALSFIIITFISSFYVGRRSNRKSVIEALLVSLIFIFISSFILLIHPNKLNMSQIYNYISILIVSLLSCKLSNKYKIKNKD